MSQEESSLEIHCYCQWCRTDHGRSVAFPPFPPSPHCCLTCKRTCTGGRFFGRWADVQLSKAEVRRLRIQEREEEIFSKPPDQLTKQEKEWLIKVDRFLHPKTPAGRPREERNEEWLAKIARAKVLGIKKPTVQELASLQKPPRDAPLETQADYDVDIIRLRDALEKAKKRRQLPIPPIS